MLAALAVGAPNFSVEAKTLEVPSQGHAGQGNGGKSHRNRFGWWQAR